MVENYIETHLKTKEYVHNQLISFSENPYNNVCYNEYVVRIGTSILEAYFDEYIGQGIKHGSFVEAVAENDLMKAMSNCDSTNIHYIKFYCSLLYNFSPTEVL